MTFVLVGLSHHVAPVELRERVTLDSAAAAELARSLGDAVCLSTCNRTELYLSSVDEERAVATLEHLAGESLDGVLYRLHEDEAAVHLFRVASGLDSLVPGEGEILGQVRDAYESVTPGPTLDRVFRQALGVGKRVRTETAIGESPASVSSAAAALAAQVFGDLKGRRVLLVGAGRIGELAASNLASRGAEIAFVANRTVETAQELAHRFGGVALALDELSATLGEVDVVLSSTSSPDAVVRAADVPAKRRAPLFFIDIAVPRDLDPAIAELSGCFLYDIDDLEAVVAETLDGAPGRGGTRGAARRGRGRTVPRLARFARRRARYRVAARPRGGDQERGAREGAGERRRAADARVGDRADLEQAAPPADGADEGSGRQQRRRRLR